MFAVIARLCAITLGTLLVVGIGVLFVRSMGSHQHYEAPPHPWFQQTEWVFQTPAKADLCGSVSGWPPNLKWVIQLTHNREQWLGPCDETFDQTLSRLKGKHLLFKIAAHESMALNGWLDQLITALEHAGVEAAVWAPSQKIARYLRHREPGWLFAADSGALLRLHLFTSLGIESAMDFWPDFVVASAKSDDGSVLSAREEAELHRRHRRVIWRGSEDPPFKVDGRLYE